MPFWFLPKEVGLRARSMPMPAALCDYKGPTSWAATGEVNVPGCMREHDHVANRRNLHRTAV